MDPKLKYWVALKIGTLPKEGPGPVTPVQSSSPTPTSRATSPPRDDSCPLRGALHRRTVRYLVSLAAETTFPRNTLSGGHSIGEGYWFEFAQPISKAQLVQLDQAVRALINAALPITVEERPYEEVEAYLQHARQPYAAALVRSRVRRTLEVNVCGEQYRLYGTPLNPDTGLSGHVSMQLLEASQGVGFVVAYTDTFRLQPALVSSLACHKGWAESASGIKCLGHLNQLDVMPHNARRKLILEAEFRQEHKLVQIAGAIEARKGKVRVLCIAGPTSSGKTTFANKLSMYLHNIGYVAKALTVDHYYLSLPDQPKYKIRQDIKDVNFDHIESMDIQLVNQHILALLDGQQIMTPNYSFKTALREGAGTPFSLPSNGIVVMEGIHALNPAYTAGLPPDAVFRVYISPLSVLQVDDFNVVKSTNHRLLRRMCRDFLFRGRSVSRTLEAWDRVRTGEEEFIFPFQNHSDFVMNSAMEYELCILKTFLAPGLHKVTPDDPQFEKAQELLLTLSYVASWDDRDVPNTSLLREFIGNGAFDEH